MFSYSFDKGWEETDFKFDDSFDDLEKSYQAAGFNKIDRAPENLVDSFFCTEVYAFTGGKVGRGHSFEYMVSLNLGVVVEDIMVPNLPSLIELMAKISSVNLSALFRERESARCQEEFKPVAKPRSW